MVTLPAIPARIEKLPRDERGYPVPWFVEWIDGRPEFRIANGAKRIRAVRERLCWVCGARSVHQPTFVIGPMCAVNRTTAEPPCHYDCAEFSARACPFLSRPAAERREANLPEGTSCDGYAILRNPGCCALWTCRRTDEGYRLFRDGKGGFLFRLPEPLRVAYFAMGREASRAEVLASMESGRPLLEKMALVDGPAAVAELERRYEDALRLIPAA